MLRTLITVNINLETLKFDRVQLLQYKINVVSWGTATLSSSWPWKIEQDAKLCCPSLVILFDCGWQVDCE